MISAVSSGVTDTASVQASRLALLTKLFQTSGKTEEKARPAPSGPPPSEPPPPPPPPANTNSPAGLASMFQGLHADADTEITDLLSRLMQALDTNGDGTISAEEMEAAATQVTDALQGGSSADATGNSGGQTVRQADPQSPYEALFQALQTVLAQTGDATVSSSAQRYTDLLQSLAKAG